MNGILTIYKNPPFVASTQVVQVPYNYGNLYNWYAVNTGKLAPSGWRVPSNSEWTDLSTYLGGNSVSGAKLKSERKEPSNHPRWTYPNVGADNLLNFSSLPCGLRFDVGRFDDMGNNIYIWTSTSLRSLNIYYGQEYINFASWLNNSHGFCVRCLRDATGAEQTLTDGTYLEDVQDIDGNWYKSIKIGTQVWFNQALKTTSYNDGTPIPNVTDNSAWAALTTGAYCTYNNLPLSTYEDATYYYTVTEQIMISDKDTRQDWNYRRHGFSASYGAIYTPTLKLHKFFFNTPKGIAVTEFKARKINTCDHRQKVIADEITITSNLLVSTTNIHDLTWVFLAEANLTGLSQGYWEYYIEFDDTSSYISELMYVPDLNNIDETAPDFNNDFSLDFNA